MNKGLYILLGLMMGLGALMANEKVIIAHRGASAYLPEHTLEAYALAYGMGADIIEPDVVLTREGILICSHDLYLETTTDVAEKFPERKRDDGHYYAIDFTLQEIKQLRAFGRTPVSERGTLPRFEVPTLEEMIQLIQRMNKQTGRDVGIVPEPKSPAFHAKEGKPIEEPLLRLLERYGYKGRDANAIIQCFEMDSLRKMREELRTDLPLVFLTSTLISESVLSEFKQFGDGIGAYRFLIEDAQGRAINENGFVKACRHHGLKVYVWTLKNEVDAARRFLYDYGVDGIFIDNPDAGVQAKRKE